MNISSTFTGYFFNLLLIHLCGVITNLYATLSVYSVYKTLEHVQW